MGPCSVLEVCVSLCVCEGPSTHSRSVGPMTHCCKWHQQCQPQILPNAAFREGMCVCVQVVQLGHRQTKVCRHALPQNVCFRRCGGSSMIFFSIISHTHTWLYRSLWQRRIYMSNIQECVTWFTLRSHFGQYLKLFSLAEQNLTFPSYMLLAALRSPTSKDCLWISILALLRTKTYG